MKKKLIALLLIIVMSLSLLACNKSEPPANSQAPATDSQAPATDAQPPANQGAPVVVNSAWYQFPNSLDPVMEDIAVVNYMVYQVYDRLVKFDPDSNDWLPGIAKSWERVGTRSWTFDIDLSYKFHNGDQLTMDDIVFSIERLKDIPKQADVANLLESISYEGNTLTLVGVNEDSSIAHRILTVAVIVNKKYVESGGDEALFSKPIGTGPYVVTEFTPGNSCSLQLWEDYPFTKPKIDQLNYTFIPETATRYMAIETGSIQFSTQFTPLELAMAADDPNLSTLVVQTRLIYLLFCNTEVKPFDNVNVRRGLVYAFNREGFCSLAGGKVAYETPLFCGYDDLAYTSPNLPTFDLAKAKEILAQEGYDESNPLEFTLTVNSTLDPGLEMYQSDLKQIGVTMNVEVLEFSVFLATEGSGNFEMIYTPNRNNGDCAVGDLDRFDWNFFGSRNNSRYSNPEAQTLIEAMRVENDQAKLKQMAIELQDIIQYDVPMVAVYLNTSNNIFDSRLTGIVVDRNGIVNYRNASFSG